MRLPAITTVILLLSLFTGVKAQTSQQYPAAGAERIEVVRSVEVYPNPTSEFIHIRIDQLNADDVKLTLHNIIGNVINVETEVVDEHEIRVRVKDLASGYYLLALKDEETQFQGTYKFLKI